MTSATTSWLLESDEPWTRYRALVDLAEREATDPEVAQARSDMLEHELVVGLTDQAATWPGYALKRHNDAAHPLHAIATLADFGMTRNDPAIGPLAERILVRFDGTQFETLLWLPRFLTKEDDTEDWSWMLCDAPTLLYALLAYGYEDEEAVRTASEALARMAVDNGWRCGAADSLPGFSGPGRATDTCPMATTCSLKALSLTPYVDDSGLVGPGIEAILSHWENQAECKLKMFGIGTEFRKLRYPFVWYDILHVADVLSRFPLARCDPRFSDMIDVITRQTDPEGRYTASAMFRSWKDWSFADKRHPSPWLTFLVHRIRKRVG